jgi:hypothetical protein
MSLRREVVTPMRLLRSWLLTVGASVALLIACKACGERLGELRDAAIVSPGR